MRASDSSDITVCMHGGVEVELHRLREREKENEGEAHRYSQPLHTTTRNWMLVFVCLFSQQGKPHNKKCGST